jgi:dipeptidyl aminopeptidase/acylaminoacyl peptidase
MNAATARALVRAQVALESYRLSADGSSVVYVLRRVVGDDYQSHLYTRPFRGGRPRQLTRGKVRDLAPDLAPDGRQLAFIRSPVGDAEAVGQVWILPLDGGEPWQLTSLEHGVSSVRWSPDGRRLAVVAQAGDHRFIVGGERKGRTPTARRITRTDFRDDESGHVVRRTHLWTVAVRPGARPRQLTKGDFDVSAPAWTPDGRRIAFAADPGEDVNLDPRSRIFIVAAGGGPVRELMSLAGDVESPAFSPEGRRLAFIGTDVADPPNDILPSVWVADLPGGRPRNLTASLDRPVGDWAWSDLVMAEDVAGPIWLDDDSLLVLVGTRGRNVPYRVGLDGHAAPLVDPRMNLDGAGLAATPDGKTVTLSAGLDGRSGEVYAIERGALRSITREGSRWQRRLPKPRIDELEIPGAGGPIQAWLASPPDAGRRRLPLVVALHGGPTGAWAGIGTMDATMLCAAGYRVLMPNIRGSTTFGADWIRPLAGHWGEPDAEDAIASVDAMVQRGLADPSRLYVMGLSYGGYLAQWLIGVTDRFAAAAADNGVANQVSVWANSHFGVHYNRRHGLGDPLSDEGMHRLWHSSPLRNAGRITTPLLILQAEEDRICPPADNEQLFTALKVLGREVEYILYPDEHHELKNYGRPDRRIDRMERILAWFDGHRRPPAKAPRTASPRR